jgi:hypothetical protein
VEAVWKAVQDTGRPLAAAALNAGIVIGGAFIDTALADELRMIAINATSQVHLAKRIVPGMVAAHSGRLLFTSSLSATTPYETVYGPPARAVGKHRFPPSRGKRWRLRRSRSLSGDGFVSPSPSLWNYTFRFTHRALFLS